MTRHASQPPRMNPRSPPDAGLHALARVSALAAGALVIGALVLAGAGGRATHGTTAAEPAARGLEQWRRHHCGACHAIYGLGGHLGPDLTNVARRRNEAYVRHVLRYGMGAMPGLGLSDAEAGDLLAYLRHLDRLGGYPLNSPWAPPYGSQP